MSLLEVARSACESKLPLTLDAKATFVQSTKMQRLLKTI